jgi:hypothetical protein
MDFEEDTMDTRPVGPMAVGAACFLVLFCILFWGRQTLSDSVRAPATLSQLPKGATGLPLYTETWKQIRQDQSPIGFSHWRIYHGEGAYHLRESIQMRLASQGIMQDITIRSKSLLNNDYSLRTTDVTVRSGVFAFNARATIDSGMLSIVTRTEGDERRRSMPITTAPYIGSGALLAVGSQRLDIGDAFVFPLFDPLTLSLSPMRVEATAKELLDIDGRKVSAWLLRLTLKNTSQDVWISERGEVLKEQGMLGIVMERTGRDQALSALPGAASVDLVYQSSVNTNRPIADPSGLSMLRLRLKRPASDLDALVGHRQTLNGDVIEIRRETLGDLPASMAALEIPSETLSLLLPEPLIQSDHEDIAALSAKLSAKGQTPLDRLTAIVDWVYRNIEKRPVFSIPDALSTLKHGHGDCNEHAVLTAALARSAGLPALVEAGLVYRNGRFYFHAWNRVFVGRWVTVDAVFNQIPADVTHIRLSTGADGLDMLAFLGIQEVSIVE